MINSLHQIDYSHLERSNEAAAINTPTLPYKLSPSKSRHARNLNMEELRSENELMQSMIERLMEENAQLRAERMLLSAASGKNENLYASVKSKPFMSYDQSEFLHGDNFNMYHLNSR